MVALVPAGNTGEPGKVPPIAPFWVPGPRIVRTMAPVLPPRSPSRAAFGQEEMGGVNPIESSKGRLSLSAAKIVPAAVVFPRADSDGST